MNTGILKTCNKNGMDKENTDVSISEWNAIFTACIFPKY
jgi:hypothetical protein